MIRFVQDTDIQDIIQIYAPYIKDTAITFEYEIPTYHDMLKRVQNISQTYPYIVYLSNQQVIAYAYAHAYSERAAYQWSVELSIYVHKDHLRQGIGQILYNALLDLLKAQNIHTVYACITSPNDNSDHFHQALGFKAIGHFTKAGFKLGKWRDVTWYEKTILDYEEQPRPMIPIQDLNSKIIHDLLQKYQ